MLHSSSDSDSDTGVVAAPRRSVPAIGESSSRSCRPRRQAQLPSLFRSDSDSDNNDGSICGCNEPEGLGDEIVFWIDCSICGEWAHNLCAFGKNSITRQYVCINC